MCGLRKFRNLTYASSAEFRVSETPTASRPEGERRIDDQAETRHNHAHKRV